MAFLLTYVCADSKILSESFTKPTSDIPRCDRLFINISQSPLGEANWALSSDSFLDLSKLTNGLSQTELYQLAIRAAAMVSTHNHTHLMFHFGEEPITRDQVLELLSKLHKSKTGRDVLKPGVFIGVLRHNIVLYGFEPIYKDSPSQKFSEDLDVKEHFSLKNLVDEDITPQEQDIAAAMQGMPSSFKTIVKAIEEVADLTYYNNLSQPNDIHAWSFFNPLCVGRVQDADKYECVLLGTDPGESTIHEVRSALKGQQVAIAVHTSEKILSYEKQAYRRFESDQGSRVALYCRY